MESKKGRERWLKKEDIKKEKKQHSFMCFKMYLY